MANEWFTPTDFHIMGSMKDRWTSDFKGKLLSAELGFEVNTTNNLLSAWTANGWTRPFFDHFDGTPVGQTPVNIVEETVPKTLSQPEWWWSYGRGPTGSGSPVTPGYSRPDFNTPQYQILAPSILGIGACRLPTVTINGTTYNGQFLSGHMQTQRRDSDKVPPEAPGTWSFANNLAYSQCYGYYESRSKAPRYRGSWPGSWLISDDEWFAGQYPRIELDIVEIYLSATSEDGISHHTPWLHRTQQAAWTAPGWTLFDRGWSSNSSNLDNYNYYPDGSLKKWDDGFHTFGMYLKKDATAPGGLGWMIFYVDRIENCRIPLITEWLRHYYLLISHQTHAPYQQELSTDPGANPSYNYMDYYKQYWYEVDYVGCWRNPSVVDPPRLTPYFPPVLTDPIKTVSIARIERHLSVKSDTLVAGSIQTPEHSSVAVPPLMPQSARFILIQGTVAGTIVGTVTVANAPTNPVKYRLTGTNASDFVINKSTGEIKVAPGVTLSVLKHYELKVTAWSNPLVPQIPGTNATFVAIDIREDAIFGFKYWTRTVAPYPIGDAIPKLRWWLDAQDAASYDLDTGKVVRIRDKSTYTVDRNQTDLTKCPVVNATGIGGHPAWESLDSNVYMIGSQIITASAIANVVTKASGVLSVSGGGSTPNSVYNFVDPTIFFCAWKADPAVNPDDVLMSVNGTVLTPATTSPTNKSYTIAMACVFKADSAGGGSNGTIHSGQYIFNESPTIGRWFDGKLGEIGIIYWANNEGITEELHQKLVGGLAHKWSLTGLLPAAHPYKTVAPKLWEPNVFTWPDASNSGAVLGAQTAYTGSLTISGANVLIENKIITGSLRVTGANFIMRNCTINSYSSAYGADCEDAVNPLIEYCTFNGPGLAATANAAILGSGTFRRNNIVGSENGIVLQAGASTASANFIHDLLAAGADPHYDGISVQGAQDGVLIQDNYIDGRDTADVFIKDDFGSITNVVVNHNYLTGNPGFNIYVDGRGAGGTITNVTISNNIIDVAQSGGAFSIDEATPTITGNVDTVGNPVT